MTAITPAGAKPVTGTGAVFTGFCTLRGVAIHDTSGAGNTVKVFDGTSAAGPLLAVAVLASGGVYEWHDSSGVRAATGLYLQTTGAVEGAVFVS